MWYKVISACKGITRFSSLSPSPKSSRFCDLGVLYTVLPGMSLFEGIRLLTGSVSFCVLAVDQKWILEKLFSIECLQNLSLLKYEFMLLNVTFIQVMAKRILYR